MKKIKIVADSSSDVLKIDGVDFESVPLKIITVDREFVDDASLDVAEMVDYLLKYKGKSQTSCPNPEDWLAAFGDAEEIYCITITSSLSGSYNSACRAKELYEKKHEGARVCVIDSLSTGPEMALIIEKLREMVLAEMSFDDITEKISEYKKSTGLLFVLESMQNLANNGRVSKLVAKFAGLMNIRVLGKASDVGTLETLDKPRGKKMTVQKVVDRLLELGYAGGRMFITHCFNEEAVSELCEAIKSKFKGVKIAIDLCRGLCSFYAEKGGMLIGFEKATV